jgi:ribosomal protein L11 methyltransferase
VSVEPAVVPEVDWVARFRAGFEAFSVGRFRVQPAWGVMPPDPGQLPLVVDPGRAFGTGTHESTRLCLGWLEELAREAPLPSPVLDLGTGSGILAVAARRLGAIRVFAADEDPEAVRSAREHGRLNDTPLRIVQADGGRGLRARGFGLVLANIAAPFLRSRAGEIAGLVAPGGMLVLSGFLGEDLDTVRAAYTALGPAESRLLGEWAALLVRRPA